jgi:hypothetical protein
MGTIDLPKGPSASYPQQTAAALRNTPSPEDLQRAVTTIIEDEADAIIRYLNGKLSPEALERLDVKSGLKAKLHSSINRLYQDMFNRYEAVGSQDEASVFTHHSSDEIAELLRSMGGAGRFNTGGIEKSAGLEKPAGGRQSMHDLESHTNKLLKQNTPAKDLRCGGTAVSVVKCHFRDGNIKPRTVTDAKLAINIPDTALIGPNARSHAAAKYLIKEIISRHVIDKIDRVMGAADQEQAESLKGLLAEIAPPAFDAANVRGNVAKSADIETIRSCGFAMAVNSLVAILGDVHLDYQFIENLRNGRELIIREYEDSDPANLPDEHYAIRLRYFDGDQLAEDCAAYDTQIHNFEHAVQHLWNLIEVVYQDSKSVFKVNDFEDITKKNKGRIRDLIKQKTGVNPDKALYHMGGEITGEKDNTRAWLVRMQERIQNMYEFLYPIERRSMEDRLVRLEKECSRLEFAVNPHHLQPGLLIDIDITSIKRKRSTLNSIADALGVFLSAAYEGFQIAAIGEQPSSAPKEPHTKTQRH